VVSAGDDVGRSRLRVSDADRDEAADGLGNALAEGRLTAEEHRERLDAVYAASTYGELEQVLGDLPAGTPSPGAAEPAPAVVTAFFGSSRRGGRWRLLPLTRVRGLCGHVRLDLRQAVLPQAGAVISVLAGAAVVEIELPGGVRLVNEVAVPLGSSSSPPPEAAGAAAPTVRLTGAVLLGRLEVRRAGDPVAGDWEAAGRGRPRQPPRGGQAARAREIRETRRQRNAGRRMPRNGRRRR
jgi:hypothetical protein